METIIGHVSEPTPDNKKEESYCICGYKEVRKKDCKFCIRPSLQSYPFTEKTLAEIILFVRNCPNENKSCSNCENVVNIFFRSALNAQREEIQEKVENLWATCDKGCDIPLNDVLAILSPNNKDL